MFVLSRLVNVSLNLSLIVLTGLTAFLFLIIPIPAVHADLYGNADGLFSLKATAESTLQLNVIIDKSEVGRRIPLESQSGLVAVAVNGIVELHSEHAFARIVLEDAAGEEKLIFETNALLAETPVTQLVRVCEETGFLTNATAEALKIESLNSTIRIDEVVFATRLPESRRSANQAIVRERQNAAKIEQINRNLFRKGKRWIAGETSVSRLSYSQKKALLGGTLPNLYGFEYYKGGIFEIPSDTAAPSEGIYGDSSYVGEFTWQNRHGQDWVTPAKNQKNCGSCWAFAVTGTVELLTNLYFNQHLDLDLSEQEVISCSGAGSCNGGSPHLALNHFVSAGVGEEACFPYQAADLSCADKCTNPQDKILIGSRDSYNEVSEDQLKSLLLNGPVAISLESWNHAIGLVGYKALEAGDRIYIETNAQSTWLTIPDGDPLVGRTAWIIKNSWGTGWGQDGFAQVVTDPTNISANSVKGPVLSLVYTDGDVVCEDSDSDGYCWWGLGDKPANCPPCAALPDGDDANPDYGPMDEFGHLQLITDTVTITSPANGDIISGQPDIQLTAAANTVGGQIVRVEFYTGTNKIGESLTEPYGITWSAVPYGEHVLTAKMVTNSGDFDSEPVSIIVCGDLGDGAISRHVWTNLPGSTVDDLRASVDFPDRPDLKEERIIFEAPTQWDDNYGTRMVGYLHPPVNGSYQFWIAGNNQSELWLSTVSGEPQKQKIAEVPDYTDSREFDKYPEQQSIEIILEEGRQYFIEALHKENINSDNLAVAWRIPGRDREVIMGRFLSPYLQTVHTVRFIAGQNGIIVGETEQRIKHGEDCTPVDVTPDPGYEFTGWTGDHTGNETPLTIRNVTADMTITADFTRKTYSVTFISGENGAIIGELIQQVPHGGSTSPVSAAPDDGFLFTGWTGDHTDTESPLTLDNITADMTITAAFAPEICTVTFISGKNGSITGELVQQVPYGGSTSPVSAAPDDGFLFTSWTGDHTGNEIPLTLENVTTNMTITAEFTQKTYTVAFISGENGSIDGERDQQVQHGGSSSPVTAVPDNGYQFTGWTGSHEGSDNPLTLENVTSDMTIQSNFGPIKNNNPDSGKDKPNSGGGGGGGGGCFIDTLN